MNMREQFVAVAKKYQELTGMTESTLSARLFGAGKRMHQIFEGGDLTTGTFERTMHWFTINWPRGHRGEWPRGAQRFVKAPAEPVEG